MTFPFVNVPDVPGVPSVNFASLINDVTLLTSDLVFPFSATYGPQWGLFLDGFPVLTAQSVVSFEYRRDFTISDYPVEQGIFESYDKVQVPFLIKMRFAQGGSASDRAFFLNNLEAIAPSLDIYDAVTPEIVYPNVNIQHIDYRRTATNGVGLIVADVWLTQIIINTSSGLSFGQVINPAAGDPQNQGQTNPQTPTSSSPSPDQAEVLSI